jgi:hypothetical protein
MRTKRAWTLMAPAAVCALLTVWVVLAAADVQTASVSLLIYALANLIVYTDALDLLLRLHVRQPQCIDRPRWLTPGGRAPPGAAAAVRHHRLGIQSRRPAG